MIVSRLVGIAGVLSAVCLVGCQGEERDFGDNPEPDAGADESSGGQNDESDDDEGSGSDDSDAGEDDADGDQIDEDEADDEGAVDEADDPSVDDSVMDDAVTDEEVTDETAIDDAVTDDTVTDDAVDDAVTDDAVTDEPAVDDTVTDEGVTDEPVTDDDVVVVECMGDEECDDGNVCNGVELCMEGVCQSGERGENGTFCDLGDGDLLLCIDGNCVPTSCGDGILDDRTDEQCDDGNPIDGDGCEVGCMFSCTMDEDCDY